MSITLVSPSPSDDDVWADEGEEMEEMVTVTLEPKEVNLELGDEQTFNLTIRYS